ncbi:MAG TPA: PEGA domain-containing protein [Candidatus Saccharimonadales bacterium]|nr:PEGA domain-containing protein [Candidatus Saccharimonadales bacterium]
MDYLDPQKQRAHAIRLMVGYVLIGLAITIATVVLLYQAYGFGLGKDGEVVQNGLVFVSSQPDDAEVYINNQRYKDNSNARLQLNEGDYTIAVRKDGYREWQRNVSVGGGSLARYDYPLLVPTKLATAPVKNYAAAPGFTTQSPDRRWLLVQQPGALLKFDLYDVSDPERVAARATVVTLPEGIVTAAASAEGHAWKLTEWSNNNRHAVLEHGYPGGMEYILVDRQEPARSLNLSKALSLKAGQILTLRDKEPDRYYIHDPAARTVSSGSINEAASLAPVLSGVLAFKSYGDDMLLYATPEGAPAGQVMTMLRDGDVTYKIREIGAGAPYLLDLARYDGDWYVAVGASSDNKAYVFQNPQTVRKVGTIKNLVPAQVLRVNAPNYLAFSSNTRFVMIENGTSFAIYDAETDKNYTYATSLPLDPGSSPVPHATWMDGHRIMYVSGGKTVIFDYDNINGQTLVAASPSYLPFFDRDYRNLYTIAPPAANGAAALTWTPLLTEDDR